VSASIRNRPPDGRGHSRRAFLQRAAEGSAGLLAFATWIPAVEACDLPITGAAFPSVDGWEHRTILHFVNTIVPGDAGRALFPGDDHPLDSGGDTTAGAWSACVLDVIYDPFYGVARGNSRLLALVLDVATRLRQAGRHFYEASQAEQLEIVDLVVRGPKGKDIARAAALATSAALGAFRDNSVAALIGWPGPNGGYYDESRHPVSRWQQPVRMTTDGNLP
jgi:hypothetical protein